MPTTEVTVDGNDYGFPNLCPACLRNLPQGQLTDDSDTEGDNEYDLVKVKCKELEVGVPFCTRCAATERAWIYWLVGASLIALFGAGVVSAYFGLGRGRMVAFTLLLLVLNVVLEQFRNEPVRVLGYSEEGVTFLFKHAEYAREFAKFNHEPFDES